MYYLPLSIVRGTVVITSMREGRLLETRVKGKFTEEYGDLWTNSPHGQWIRDYQVLLYEREVSW